MEVLLHLPPAFADVDAFKSFLGIRPERRRRHTRQKRETNQEIFSENNQEPMKVEQVPESSIVDSEPILVQSPEYPVALPVR